MPELYSAHHENSTEALEARDTAFGGMTGEVFRTALEFAPYLTNVKLELSDDPKQFPFFTPDKEGIESSSIVIGYDTKPYEEILQSERIKMFVDLYAQFSRQFDVFDAQAAAFGHELGHANDYYHYIQEANGNTEEAYYKYERDGYATLPLGRTSAAAFQAYRYNFDGYRDYMAAKGFTGEAWDNALRENTEAYYNLPQEQAADEFSLRIIRDILERGN